MGDSTIYDIIFNNASRRGIFISINACVKKETIVYIYIRNTTYS